jgi:hypothetical protein
MDKRITALAESQEVVRATLDRIMATVNQTRSDITVKNADIMSELRAVAMNLSELRAQASQDSRTPIRAPQVRPSIAGELRAAPPEIDEASEAGYAPDPDIEGDRLTLVDEARYVSEEFLVPQSEAAAPAKERTQEAKKAVRSAPQGAQSSSSSATTKSKKKKLNY